MLYPRAVPKMRDCLFFVPDRSLSGKNVDQQCAHKHLPLPMGEVPRQGRRGYYRNIILILDKIAKGHFIVPLTWHTAYSGKKTYWLRFLRRKPQAAILQPDKTALAVLSKTRIRKRNRFSLSVSPDGLPALPMGEPRRCTFIDFLQRKVIGTSDIRYRFLKHFSSLPVIPIDNEFFQLYNRIKSTIGRYDNAEYSLLLSESPVR